MDGQIEKCVMVLDEGLPPGLAALTAVDFSDVAQGCKTYDEFIAKAAQTGADSLHYLGLAICGAKKLVNKLTGSPPLLR